MEGRPGSKTAELLVSAEGYFAELVKKGMEVRKVSAEPEVEFYLVKLLNHYLDARNLFEQPEDGSAKKANTLAELYLTAQNSEPSVKIELLKKLGDKSLYISGFFGDSLERKLVDLDYYAEMGCVAYGSLAQYAQEPVAQVYSVFSKRFVEFVDVLTYISHSAQVQNDQNILRLYDRYIKTGSKLAREKLMEIGIVALPIDHAKVTKQQ